MLKFKTSLKWVMQTKNILKSYIILYYIIHYKSNIKKYDLCAILYFYNMLYYYVILLYLAQ